MRNSNMAKLMIAVSLLSLLIACGGHAQKVEERKTSLFDDPAIRYPNEMYISAVSSGDTPEAAKDRAIGDVAKVIKADINLQQQLFEEYLETGTATTMDLERKSNFTRQIDITTEQTLKNVNIGKTWLDEKDGRYYAVAYLDRMDTAEIYKTDLASLEEKIIAFFGKAKTETDKLSKLAYINKAISLAIQRDIMTEQLNTISQGTESFTPTVKAPELSQARLEITQAIKVKLDLAYDKWDEFPGAVSEVLQSYGFQITDGNPDVLVTGSMRMEQLERKGNFVRWFVDLHFKDLAKDAEFVTYTDDDREGSNSFGEAERRAAMRMAKVVKQNLYERLDGYFDSLMASK